MEIVVEKPESLRRRVLFENMGCAGFEMHLHMLRISDPRRDVSA